MPIRDLLPEIALLLGALLIVLVATFTRHAQQNRCAPLALLALIAATGFAAGQWGAPPLLTFQGVWALDQAAVAAKLLIFLCTALAVGLSPEWMQTDRRHGEYYVLLLFAALGAVMLASAADTLQLMAGALLSSAAGYPLAAYHRAWAPSVEAGMKYFLVGALANALLALGVALLFGLTGDPGYQATAAALAEESRATGPALPIAIACIVIGIGFKLAAFPAHVWMPDVAQGSPAPVAALLSVVPKIGAAVALVRFVSVLPGADWRPLLALIAALTMTLGNLAALWQTDVRRLLGWSAVSQSGYALMAVTAVGLSRAATPSLLIFLAAYAAANLAAFAAVTALRGRTALGDYRGLAGAQPLLSGIFILALLSLTGIPPLAGFFGKLAVFAVAIDTGYGWLAALAAVNTLVSLFYYLRVIAPMVFGCAEQPVYLLGRWSQLSLWLAGVLVLLFPVIVPMLQQISFFE